MYNSRKKLNKKYSVILLKIISIIMYPCLLFIAKFVKNWGRFHLGGKPIFQYVIYVLRNDWYITLRLSSHWSLPEMAAGVLLFSAFLAGESEKEKRLN